LKRAVKKDKGLGWQDVEQSVQSQAIAVRREMEDVSRKNLRIEQMSVPDGKISMDTSIVLNDQ
jgi:hypothetical protein